LYGRVEGGSDSRGAYNPLWLDWRLLVGVPHDLPVAGFGGETVNSLRLFSARASDQFDMDVFNEGDYLRAVEGKIAAETVSKVLYPSDSFEAGRELRLVQEIFLVCCALRDALRRDLASGGAPASLADRVAIQLNDTHPAFAVVELMRLLVDEREEPWERAWATTQAVLAYTNHTLMAEALERWPVALVERVAPRHLEILYEINRRFLEDVAARWPGDVGRLARMSIVEEQPVRQVRMANLAIVGSHSVNGVARLHSQLVRDELVPDFVALWPERFNNKTNGVSFRRWLLVANPALSALICEAIGEAWIKDGSELRRLAPFADEDAFLERTQLVKAGNKRRLSAQLATLPGPRLDPERLLDVQVKRIHEYKRQLLNVLCVLDEYLTLIEDGVPPPAPRSILIAGKAAPGYALAKQIIRLAHAVAALLAGDPRARPWLELVFVPDYRVTLAETIIPAGELSEQISTAGTEASGTSNMKFALNGALTIGTLDGATVEMSEAIGAENLFLFGLRSEEIAAHRRIGSYRPRELYRKDPGIRRTLDTLASPAIAGGEFAWLRDRLLDDDAYFLLADWAAYRDARRSAGLAWLDRRAWTRKAVLGIASMGYFSSDRAIAEYAAGIWGVDP
nr:glycogen/starch/alpha-glucan phosphorylase [Thermoanaerobaculia bacterium]